MCTVMILLFLYMLSIATPLLVKGLNDHTEENVQVPSTSARRRSDFVGGVGILGFQMDLEAVEFSVHHALPFFHRTEAEAGYEDKE